MNTLFPIYFYDEIVGEAQCRVEGLFYHISCSIKPEERKLYRVIAESDFDSVDLGICVPDYDHFILSKRLPIKKMMGKPRRFCLVQQSDNEKKIPILEGQEFSFLDKIANAKYEFQKGISYIIISKL